ncbi:sugar ABC transporter ATP-binding protein [Kocuria rosea]|uniref:ABC transporter ATP-binding protein n=1 Tax=Kocuria rosea TaxID=1275 RepID=UPI000D659670|nr:sn-glycerol-3-phosphate ABC transporter ATP-binding protein UgpC [Kocuria rosea]PWF85533.1 sugar ABC transporter ATP-binding protein [Kocuria rosea]QCY33823.1 sn-glycerol-3-phosphate ABC transporter ATP-binding protein UgpC [Kocuria rosea]TQN35519.1 carbohydrate ABC transporter ATP-binding protein (CUT1 family) [Kocuria rosea]
MSSVRYANVTCQYPGAERPSVTDLNLDIADGEFLVLVGPSGCGKSTTLRMLAGLEEVTGGNIYIGDRDVTDVPSRDRDIAMVFQNYALYPHMTVAENMGFALKIAKISPEERRRRVEEAAKILDLTDYLDRKPKALSGGQRQRVAMGRAIVRSPQVFLMDEPLSNLDAKLRVQTRTQIASLTRRLGVTTVYVTHDQVEAMTMGDRVAVLKDGLLMQVDTPRALYDRPATEFVAGFIGSPAMNLFRVPVAGGAATFGTMRIELTAAQQAALTGDKVTVGIRPEDLHPAAEGTGLPIEADVVEELGADAFVYGHLAPVTAANTVVTVDPTGTVEEDAAGAHEIIVRVEGRTPPRAGATIWVAPNLDHVHLFDTATGNRLPD